MSDKSLKQIVKDRLWQLNEKSVNDPLSLDELELVEMFEKEMEELNEEK
jgi:hypothetical protein